MVSVSLMYSCEVCGTEIEPDSVGAFVCSYCGERHKMSADSYKLDRLSDSPIPTYSIDGEVYTLREIGERFENANRALYSALFEFKAACRLYEAARPRKPKGEE